MLRWGERVYSIKRELEDACCELRWFVRRDILQTLARIPLTHASRTAVDAGAEAANEL